MTTSTQAESTMPDDAAQAMQRRQELLDAIANEPSMPTRRQVAEDLEAARKAVTDAQSRLVPLEQGYTDTIRATQAQVNRVYEMRKEIAEIEAKFPEAATNEAKG